MFMKYSALTAIALISVVFSAPVVAHDTTELVVRGSKQFSEKVLVSGLAGPWELTWGPDDVLWVTERAGKRVTRIDPLSGEQSVAITIDEVSAPGNQDGLLGMALHPELIESSGNDFVYVAYTYVDEGEGAVPAVADPGSRYRYLYMKIVRLTYNEAEGTLSDPVDVITGLPTGNDHNAGRLKIGPDKKLYLTIGDKGNNQLGNFCQPIESQRLPTQQELDGEDYVSYVGKSLRLNLDGSVPGDNPELDGVVSHVYTYGHRNPQGLDFAPDGTLYSAEHGPKTDDEVNILKPGANYGWPHVAGRQDDNAYVYARWAEATSPCADLKFNDLAIDPSVPIESESDFAKPFVSPIATMFTVQSDFNFEDPVCNGINYICWPTVGASSVEYYQSEDDGIPGWDHVLLVTTLKRGSLYVAPLNAEGQATAGHMRRYFQSDNRLRDTAVSPDRKTIYIATDARGLAQAVAGGTTRSMQNPGAIIAFTYEGEGTATSESTTKESRQVSESQSSSSAQTAASSHSVASGMPPQFTAEQAAAGKTAYNSNCAVCHGNNMTNGTFGTPLAGKYFKSEWSGKTVRAFFDYAKTMPPTSPASLPDDTYADIVAYVFEINGVEPGDTELPVDGEVLREMTIQ
jgi:PQQ-dependent dehydrogenase (s-GDH family)